MPLRLSIPAAAFCRGRSSSCLLSLVATEVRSPNSEPVPEPELFGTRNCDWLFTVATVTLLGTGRYGGGQPITEPDCLAPEPNSRTTVASQSSAASSPSHLLPFPGWESRADITALHLEVGSHSIPCDHLQRHLLLFPRTLNRSDKSGRWLGSTSETPSRRPLGHPRKSSKLLPRPGRQDTFPVTR